MSKILNRKVYRQGRESRAYVIALPVKWARSQHKNLKEVQILVSDRFLVLFKDPYKGGLKRLLAEVQKSLTNLIG
jgi:hypothetical protein